MKHLCSHPSAVGLGNAPKRYIRFYCETCRKIILEHVSQAISIAFIPRDVE